MGIDIKKDYLVAEFDANLMFVRGTLITMSLPCLPISMVTSISSIVLKYFILTTDRLFQELPHLNLKFSK